MFIFIRHYNSSKASDFTQHECGEDIDVAKDYAETILKSSVDIKAVEMYQHQGTVNKIQKMVWE